MIRQWSKGLNADQISAFTRLARLPEMIRGYGHVKEESIKKFEIERTRVEAEIQDGSFAIAAE